MYACRDPVKWLPESETQQKVSVVFSFPEEPGQLFNALSAFALRDINLTKIESRPFKDDPIKLGGRRFQYRFYIDFAGQLGSTKVQNAIVHLQVLYYPPPPNPLPFPCSYQIPASFAVLQTSWPPETSLKRTECDIKPGSPPPRVSLGVKTAVQTNFPLARMSVAAQCAWNVGYLSGRSPGPQT